MVSQAIIAHVHRTLIDLRTDAGESVDAGDLETQSVAQSRRARRCGRPVEHTSPDVTAVVTERLRKSKISTERKHHGKKPAASALLGRQKGSKRKQDARRAIKDGDTF